jgi:hypothetical protein
MSNSLDKQKNQTALEADHVRKILRELSHQDFLSLGMHKLSYIAPKDHLGKRVYALYGADGSPLLLAETLEIAQMAALQQDLAPIVVH